MFIAMSRPLRSLFPYLSILLLTVSGYGAGVPNDCTQLIVGIAPDWNAKQKMRHNDFAYRWLVEIRHNSDPPVPGAGSAIFFHIRRGVDRPSAGCTTMAEPELVKLVSWLRASRRPCYVLLPAAEYDL